MLTRPDLVFQRNKRVDKLELSELKTCLELCGYFPEANIIPPFFDITQGTTGIASKARSSPITHFVTKSAQQWRDFKLVRPENYTHTVDLISRHLPKVKTILKSPQFIYSYSTPFTFSTQEYRTGNQIAGWSNLQKQLLATSGRYKLPYLLQIDLQNCYHTLYTHCIEWAFESIGYKNIGNKLDESTRRGNNNRTHGLPVGHFTTEILAEVVLSWVDVKIESVLKDMNVTGYRFKDNYYFLCPSNKDAQNVLSKVAAELRNSHFTINDSKTEIGPFSEYYSARWQAEYDYLLESLRLNDEGATFNERKLKVFIEQTVNLSLKYEHKKSIVEKAIALITISSFEGHINYKWLFYAISNMLPLRTLSYPKLLVFLKKITNDNPAQLQAEFDDFISNEILFASDREDAFALIWIAYLLHDSSNKTLKKDIKKALAALSSKSTLSVEALKYLRKDKTTYVLWEDNASRIKFDFKDYMQPDQLNAYLGVSFSES